MTKTNYDRQQLDELGYRLFDLACGLRTMAHQLREAPLDVFQIHDRKALAWLGSLEDWVDDAQARLRREANRARGTRRARSFGGRRAESTEKVNPESTANSDDA
jgi:hypothetical protein